MKNYTLEVCADSVESVLAAESGGATRIELCQNLVIGGTTPDASLFKEIRRYSDICIHILVRPRYGDFLYSDYEFDIMKDEIGMFRAPGRTSGSGKNGWSERGSRGYVRDTAQSL